MPTLVSAVGHEFDDRITTHAQMEQFARALATASPRVKLLDYGKSYEGRTLY